MSKTDMKPSFDNVHILAKLLMLKIEGETPNMNREEVKSIFKKLKKIFTSSLGFSEDDLSNLMRDLVNTSEIVEEKNVQENTDIERIHLRLNKIENALREANISSEFNQD